MKLKILKEAKFNMDTAAWDDQMDYMSNFKIEGEVLIKYLGKEKKLLYQTAQLKQGAVHSTAMRT